MKKGLKRLVYAHDVHKEYEYTQSRYHACPPRFVLVVAVKNPYLILWSPGVLVRSDTGLQLD